MRFRDTLEIGDRDITVTWINTNNTEYSCSHTYKASVFILDYSIAHISIYQCLLRVHRCTAGCVAKPSVMIHTEGRQRLGATQKLPGYWEYFTNTEPISLSWIALTTTSHSDIQPEGTQLLTFPINNFSIRYSPFINVNSESQYPHEQEVIQFTYPMQQKIMWGRAEHKEALPILSTKAGLLGRE